VGVCYVTGRREGGCKICNMGGPSHRTIHIHNTGLSLHVVEEGSGILVSFLCSIFISLFQN
jgi:hypothetical protein